MSTPARRSSFASKRYAPTSAVSSSAASRGVGAAGSSLASIVSIADCCAASRSSEVGGTSVARTVPSPAVRSVTLPPSCTEKPSEPRSLPQAAVSVTVTSIARSPSAPVTVAISVVGWPRYRCGSTARSSMRNPAPPTLACSLSASSRLCSAATWATSASNAFESTGCAVPTSDSTMRVKRTGPMPLTASRSARLRKPSSCVRCWRIAAASRGPTSGSLGSSIRSAICCAVSAELRKSRIVFASTAETSSGRMILSVTADSGAS